MAEPAGGRLRAFVVGAGVAFAVLSVVVGLSAGLQMFGDGSIFAYSVAVADAWAFHWHNISGRLFSYVFIYVPAEAAVAATGSASAGVFVYGLLLFAAPGLSLLATRVLDRTPDRTVFVFACLSAACLLPFVFGFPTEMTMAHAVFWPALAASLDASPGRRRNAVVYGLMQSLVLTHEGGVLLAGAIVAIVASRGLRSTTSKRAVLSFVAAMTVWLCVKTALPPDAHIAGVLGAAAFRFIAPANLTDPVCVLMAAALAAYVLVAIPSRRPAAAAGAVAAGLAVYWTFFDTSLLAEARYQLRTILLAGTPLLGLLAVGFERYRPIDPRVLAGALALVLLVHGVETAKFVVGWNTYKDEVRALAMGSAADPELGDTAFVSARRIADATNRLAWNSTTPYLSVLVAPGYDPARLVVDPQAGYFWLSCETATRSAADGTPIPAPPRELVRRHACFNR